MVWPTLGSRTAKEHMPGDELKSQDRCTWKRIVETAIRSNPEPTLDDDDDDDDKTESNDKRVQTYKFIQSTFYISKNNRRLMSNKSWNDYM